MPTVLADGHVLIPHLPNWAEPTECTRRWDTGVEPGLTLAEDRQALRQTPLYSLSWSVMPFDQRENEKLHAAVRAALKEGNAAAPWWGRGYKIGAAGVAPTATVIPISALVPESWLPAVDDELFVAQDWGTAGGAIWEKWVVTAVTPGTMGGEHEIEIDTGTALTLEGGALAVWPLLRGRFVAEEVPFIAPTLGTYRLRVEQTSGINPGISESGATVYWGRWGPEEVDPIYWVDPASVLLGPLPSSETLSTFARPGGYDFSTQYGTDLQEDAVTPAESTRLVSWSHDQTFNQFNAALGELAEVELTVDAIAWSKARAENLDASPRTLTVGSTVTITARDPGTNLLLTASATITADQSVTAYDGTTDFHGPGGSPGSGFDLEPMSDNNPETVTLTDADATFAQFIGGSTIALTFAATGSAIATGSPSIVSDIETRAGAELTFTYRYRKNEGYFWIAVPDWTGWAPRPGDGATLVSSGAIFPMATAADLSVTTEINGFGYALIADGTGEIYRMFRSKYPVYSGDDDSVLITT